MTHEGAGIAFLLFAILGMAIIFTEIHNASVWAPTQKKEEITEMSETAVMPAGPKIQTYKTRS